MMGEPQFRFFLDGNLKTIASPGIYRERLCSPGLLLKMATPTQGANANVGSAQDFSARHTEHL